MFDPEKIDNNPSGTPQEKIKTEKENEEPKEEIKDEKPEEKSSKTEEEAKESGLEEIKGKIEELKGKEFVDGLKSKSKDIEGSVKEISPEDKERLTQTLSRVSENIPEAVLVGGTALRIWLDINGKKIPEEYGKDIDLEIKNERFEQTSEALPPKKGKELTPPNPEKSLSKKEKKALEKIYRRKEKEKTPFGEADFLKDSENYLALEDKITNHHLDLFKEMEENKIEKVHYCNNELSLLSPEELFIKRMNQLQNSKELQRRHSVYFYLNAGIIDAEKMDELVKEKLGKNGEEINKEQARKVWKDYYSKLDNLIIKAEEEGSIKEGVEHW